MFRYLSIELWKYMKQNQWNCRREKIPHSNPISAACLHILRTRGHKTDREDLRNTIHSHVLSNGRLWTLPAEQQKTCSSQSSQDICQEKIYAGPSSLHVKRLKAYEVCSLFSVELRCNLTERRLEKPQICGKQHISTWPMCQRRSQKGKFESILNWLKIKTKDFKTCGMLLLHSTLKGSEHCIHLREEGVQVSNLSSHLTTLEKGANEPPCSRRMDTSDNRSLEWGRYQCRLYRC